MDPFEQRPPGRSRVMLPRLGFGRAPLGNHFTVVSNVDAEATMDAAWTGGVRYYDTSPWYGRGLSERRIGNYLLNQPRAVVRLSTKVGRIFTSPADPEAFSKEHNARHTPLASGGRADRKDRRRGLRAGYRDSVAVAIGTGQC